MIHIRIQAWDGNLCDSGEASHVLALDFDPGMKVCPKCRWHFTQYYGLEMVRRARELIAELMAGKLTKARFRSLEQDGGHYGGHRLRRMVASESWCLPTVEWLNSMERLLAGKRVLEVCAGNGHIARLMRARGIDWTATDIEPGHPNVEKMNALEAVEQYKPDVIFVSWIPYGSDLDVRLASLGIPMVIVGELGGCTGTDAFYKEFDPRAADGVFSWFEDLPSWDFIHDYTMLLHWFEPDSCNCDSTSHGMHPCDNCMSEG
jgi:hypothetical protein